MTLDNAGLRSGAGMSLTESLHHQHEEIEKLAKRIESGFPSLESDSGAADVHGLLLGMERILTVHLALEDKALYPQLAESSNGRARAMSQEYMDEMGDLAEGFKEYFGTWSSGVVIKDSAALFCGQTKEIFALLRRRIEKEEKYLYPLVNEVWS